MALSVRWVTTGPFQENSYLLLCDETREALLVDPGDEPDRIAALVERENARPVLIVATHGHIDHVGAVGELQSRYGVRALAPEADQGWIDALPMQAQMFRLRAPVPPRIDGALEDGQEIVFGNVRGRALATPGHTEGGTCLYFEADRVLLTGDTLFCGSVGRTDLPGGSFEQLAHSIRTRLFVLPDDVTFYSGHGPPGRLGDEKRTNPFVGESATQTPRIPRMP